MGEQVLVDLERARVRAAGVVEDLGQTAGRELVTEENGEQESRANEVGPRVGRDPRLEGLAPRIGDRVRHAVPRAGVADLHVPALGEDAQLPVDLAAGDIPEVADGQLDERVEVPAGHGPVGQEPQQRSRGGVQGTFLGGHVDMVARPTNVDGVLPHS